MSEDKSANKTLFRAPAKAPRAHAKADAGRGPASDVVRGRGLVFGALAAFGGFGVAALVTPPASGHLSPGPLSRPHVKAGLPCSACHSAGYARTGAAPLVPNATCEGCHGPHEASPHAAVVRAGAMTCATCHTVHRGEEGVTFEPGAPPIHYAGDVEIAAPGVTRFATDHVVTVPLVPSEVCAKCHAVGRDVSAECLPGAGISRCFAQHLTPTAAGAGDGSRVCAAQHTTDRFAAWEAALEVAKKAPISVARRSGGNGVQWGAAGAAAAGIGFAAAAILAARKRRRRDVKGAPPAALAVPAARVRLPQIDVSTCLGCSACVDACPYDVLEIDKYVAVVSRPEACCGLTLCEQRCPNGSLRITEGEPVGDRPRISDGLESLDVPGLFLAGDVTGLPLIKNAIAQGARAADAAGKGVPRGPGSSAGVDLLIVGAGPAGLSAALRAKELGLSFEVVEQGSVAQSIRSFPRGKLVFDQPLELPVEGKLWLEESTKEDLLSHWLRIVRRERLPVREDTRVVDVRRAERGFVVVTEPREGGPRSERAARRVILAIGQRGTPRRLPFALAADVEARVHYHLFDARSFEGKRVVVVGLGDVAMEAAIALSRQAKTEVTVVHRGPTFTRGKSRNIAEMKRLAGADRVRLLFSTEVTGAEVGKLDVCASGKPQAIPCDAVLVLIGSIPPWSTLRGLGVRTIGDAAEIVPSPAP